MTNPLHADAGGHFMSTMGLEHDVDDQVGWGRVTLGPYLCTGKGWPSAAVLITFADVLIGRLASQRTMPRISVTANLGVRMVGTPPPDGQLKLHGRLVKTGRTMSVGETIVTAAGSGDVVATSLGTFLASPRPQDVAPDGFRRTEPSPVPDRVAPTLAEHVGLQLKEPGVVTAGLRPDLFNATESLQGGVTALMGELAAQTAATEAAGVPHVLDTLDVYYLAAGRVGPFVTRTRMLSAEPARTLAQVEVRDSGRDDRLLAVILSGTRPSPG